MTQQDIVNAVNHLTVSYNVSWQDIKYDADKAILKINSYLGAMYPKMSEVLTGPETSYSIKQKGKDIPIFPEQYLHSVVIPFIASEVLARDEEFTTVYNKYLLEVEDGLFLMASNEYNRIPDIFLQHDTTGVFFSETSIDDHYTYGSHHNYPVPHKPIHKEYKSPIEFTFSVFYVSNNPNIIVNDSFFIDGNKYHYNDTYKIKTIENKHYYSADGTKCYTLNHWSTDLLGVNAVEADSEYKIQRDVVIYAQWTEEDTLNISYGGQYNYVSLNSKFKDLTYLAVPRYVKGIKVTGIASNFLPDNNNINTLVLPDTLETIYAGALTKFTGEELRFPDSGNIKVEAGGMVLANSKLSLETDINRPLILPKSIIQISPAAFFASGSIVLTDSSPASDTTIRIIDVLVLRFNQNLPEAITLADTFYYVSGNDIYYRIHFIGEQ